MRRRLSIMITLTLLISLVAPIATAAEYLPSDKGLILTDSVSGEEVAVNISGNSKAKSKDAEKDAPGTRQLKITLGKGTSAEEVTELIESYITQWEDQDFDVTLKNLVGMLEESDLDIKVNDAALFPGDGRTFSTPPGIEKTEEETEEWTLVWSDEFDETSVDRTKWDYDLGNHILDVDGGIVADGWGNNELECYTDNDANSFVEDGFLTIKAIKESISDDYGSYDYSSAKLKTKGLYSQKYGRFEIRAKMPAGPGLWPAIWMLPEEDVYGGWAASGEIDIFEGWGSDTSRSSGTLHYGGIWPTNKYSGKEFHFADGDSTENFHEYAIEWEPGEIRWYVDDVLFQTQNNWNTYDGNGEKFAFPAPFDQEFYLILNLAVGGNYDGDPTDDTEFPAEMVVDYVRAYELTGRDYMAPIEPSTDATPLPADAKQADAEGNYLSNSDFTEPIQINTDNELDFGDMWNFVSISTFGGAGTASIDTIEGKNYAYIDVTNSGTENYAVQLIQLTTVGQGRYYKLSFDAKASANRSMIAKVSGGADRGWTTYSDSYSIDLTQTITSFEETFQMTADTDLAARLEFNMGFSTDDVWIGNVKLEEVPAPIVDYNASKTPLADGNAVYNGAFDKYTIDRMSYWDFNTTVDAEASIPEDTRVFVVTVPESTSEATDTILSQNGIEVSKSSDYILQFEAASTNAQNINVTLTDLEDSMDYMIPKTLSLTNTMHLYTIQFTTEDIDDNNAKLSFKLDGTSGTIQIDNVSLIKQASDDWSPQLITFDDPEKTYALTGFGDESGGAVGSVVTDPTGADNLVGMVEKNGPAWAGVIFGEGSGWDISIDPIPFDEDHTTLTLDVYAPAVGTQVLLKFEDTTKKTTPIELIKETTTANEWETITFDFSEAAGFDSNANYDKPVAIFDIDMVNDGAIYHLDNLVFVLETVDLVTFDKPVDYNVQGFEGGVGSVIADPDDANNMIGKIEKYGEKSWAGAIYGEGTEWNLSIDPIPFAENMTTLSLDVFVPTPGSTVLIKFEDTTGVYPAVEMNVPVSNANVWETVQADFSTVADFDITGNYDKPVIIFNIADTPYGEAYYFDNLKLAETLY